MRNLEPLRATHPANPITPLMMEAQEPATAAPAVSEAAPEAPAPAETEPPAPAVEPSAAATASQHAPAFVRCQIASLLLLLLGLGLGLAPGVSPAAAQWLENAGRLHLQAGTLIVAGLLLSTVTVVWRVLWGIRVSLESVGFETSRIEQIASDGQTLRDSLDTVKYANSTLAGDVTNLQVQVKRLTDIVSNPDYTVSIFRLAASVDQLGKHIELHMKEQFEGLQKKAGLLADQAGHVQSQLASRLDQVQALAKEQHRSQYSAVQDGFSLMLTASEQTNSKIDKNLDADARIEARLQDQQDSLSLGLDCVLERVTQARDQVAAGLEGLGGRVDRQLEGQAASWQAKLTGLDDRIEAAQREHASEIQELGGRLGGAFDVHVEELKQKLRTVAELSNGNRQELANQLEGLASRLDDHARNQAASVERVREQALESARSLQRDVAANLSQLENQLGEAAKEHSGVLRKSSLESQQVAGATRRELGARLEQLGMDLERQGREQQAALQKAAQEVQQASGTTRRELATKVEALGADLERRTRDQLDLLNRATQEAKAATGAAKNELAETVEQLGARLEAKLESRTNDLSSDLIELAEMFGSIRSELRASVVDAIRVWTEEDELAQAAPAPIETPEPSPLTEILAPEPEPLPEAARTFDVPTLLDHGHTRDAELESETIVDAWGYLPPVTLTPEPPPTESPLDEHPGDPTS
jgi:hypothetical protein